MANAYTSNGEQIASHIHSLVRLWPTDGYRYECRTCGARLKNKSGVMIDDLKRMAQGARLRDAAGKGK